MSKPVSVPVRINTRQTALDEVLGVFRYVAPSKTLAHLSRCLGTWTGTDKALMTVQYSSKAAVGLLLFLHRLRSRVQAGSPGKIPRSASQLTALADNIGDARILYRIWSVVPMFSWLVSLERTPPPTKLLLQVERLQAWSMVIYCPMEAIAYLGYHKVLDISASRQAWLWKHALRLWLLYVVLQFVHLVEDNRLLSLRAKALEHSRGRPSTSASAKKDVATTEESQVTERMWGELFDRKRTIMSQFWAYAGYLPASIHWAVPGGIMSEGWVGFFGTIAAVNGLLPTWKATA